MSKQIHVLSQFPNLSELLQKSLPDNIVVEVRLTGYSGQFSKHLKVGEQEMQQLKDAEILLGDNNLVAQVLYKLPKIKWIQSTWAGIDAYLPQFYNNKNIAPNFPITRFSGESFGQVMTDYCLGHIINKERNLFYHYENAKIKKIWKRDVLWDYRSSNEITVAILGGSGAIGSYMAQKFHRLGSRVVGYGRHERHEDSIKQIPLDKYSTKLEDILPECDYLISVLPSTQQTIGLLDNNKLQLCSLKKPVFINIGRGSVISESQIINALNNKWISSAILDVFSTEPLPESSPLWSHSDILITPHIAAVSRPKDVVQLFVENYQRFIAGQQMRYVIDWKSGY